MRGLLLSLVYGVFLVYGIQAPFILVLGYVWVDIFTPQLVAYGLISNLPVSLILGGLIFLFLFLDRKREKIGQQPVVWLIFIFSVWMTVTLMWAAAPTAAFDKWDWAFKSVIFACVVPFFVQGKLRLEALLWVILISGMGHCTTYGIKVLLSGGGYGVPLGLVHTNQGYGEGSTLAMFAVTLIPIALFLIKHQTIFPPGKLIRYALACCIFLSVLTAIGTFARTGLICIAVLSLNFLISTKRKFLYIGIITFSIPLFLGFAGDDWTQRMSSIGDDTEGSAMGRVAAWLWTLEYVASHPLGGSFEVYRINSYTMELSDRSILFVSGKAFHSAYFEVLGETGFPGLLMYFSLLLLVWVNLKSVIRIGRNEENGWLLDAGKSVLLIFYVYLAGSAFIGVAYQSYFYYVAAISVILKCIGKVSERKN